MRDSSTSAVTETQPAMSAALGWAPLMPPRPEVTKSRPFRTSGLSPNFMRPAFSTVLNVPCTMP